MYRCPCPRPLFANRPLGRTRLAQDQPGIARPARRRPPAAFRYTAKPPAKPPARESKACWPSRLQLFLERLDSGATASGRRSGPRAMARRKISERGRWRWESAKKFSHRQTAPKHSRVALVLSRLRRFPAGAPLVPRSCPAPTPVLGSARFVRWDFASMPV